MLENVEGLFLYVLLREWAQACVSSSVLEALHMWVLSCVHGVLSV